jgi:hypothetical protein
MITNKAAMLTAMIAVGSFRAHLFSLSVKSIR